MQARRSRASAGFMLALVALLFAISPWRGAHAETVEAELASKIILKVLTLDQNLQARSGGKVDVAVVGSPEALAAFSKLKGSTIDANAKIVVGQVIAWDTAAPLAFKPTLVFVGDRADPAEALRYTRANRVLSVTNVREHVEKGVTLGVGLEKDKPKVLLNLTGAEGEGITWDPTILRISQTVR